MILAVKMSIGEGELHPNSMDKDIIIKGKDITTTMASIMMQSCSVRLTCDVFVHDLNRQLGTPSHWLPVDSCKKRTKGRPSGRLHSDAHVSQQETPKLCTSVSEHRVWHSEGGKKNCVLCVYSCSGKQPLFQSLVRSLTTSSKQLECILGKFAKTSNPVPNILSAI